MRRFTRLYTELDETNRTAEKVAAMERYFAGAPPEDGAWGLFFLSGRRMRRTVTHTMLRTAAAEEAGVPLWLLDECLDAVGDMSETLALLLGARDCHASPAHAGSPDQRTSVPVTDSATAPTDPDRSPPLHEVVERYVMPLGRTDETTTKRILREAWGLLSAQERFIYHKLIGGAFRVGVQRRLVARALAAVAGIDADVMEHRMTGDFEPTAGSLRQLLAPQTGRDDSSKPYPFYLANQLNDPPTVLGDAREWQFEWKWDGIRAQLIRREGGGQVLVWSRGEELITDQFPELRRIAGALARDAVMDGEVLAWDDRAPAAPGPAPGQAPAWLLRGRARPFASLQTRLGRKGVQPTLFDETDLVFMAYDLLEIDGRDVRAAPLSERRSMLVEVLENVDPATPVRLSPVLAASSWEEVTALRAMAAECGAEGIMLKPRRSAYGVGRTRGDVALGVAGAGWWKWKVDPHSVDAVLIYAQPGSGKRASLFTDYTFGVWDGDQLVPFAKAYSGLTNEEIARVDAFVRRNTVEKIGPVRVLKPELVFEIAFEGIRESGRHRSGIAVRFPRIARWRTDKTAADADTIEFVRAFLDQPRTGTVKRSKGKAGDDRA